MASAAAHAQIVAKTRLQQIIASAVGAAWAQLPHYDRVQVDQWLSTVLPLTAAANRQAVALTQAFLARALSVPPAGIDSQRIVAGIRNGATPEEVYTRPFVTVWGALGRGTAWADAVHMGLERATSAAVTDVQLSFTHTLVAAGDMGGRVAGYERVPDDGACDFCQAASGQTYYTEDLMPLHSRCGCGVEPITDSSASIGAPDQFSGPGDLEVAVQDHGELGPVLTNAADSFFGPAALAAAGH